MPARLAHGKFAPSQRSRRICWHVKHSQPLATIMKILPIIAIMLFCSSCQLAESDVKEKINIQSIEELHDWFKESKKLLKFQNSEFRFIEKQIPHEQLMSILKFDTNSLLTENIEVFGKGAFKIESEEKTDSIYFFKYAVVNDSIVKQLRIRSMNEDEFIDDQPIINFDNSKDIKKDYFISEEFIYAVAYNKLGGRHHTFFKYQNGLIKQISYTPDSIFYRDEIIDYEKKKIVIYNDFKEKKLRLDSGKIGKLEGEVINSYGGKGYGVYLIVKLDNNELFNNNFISITRNGLGWPKDLYLLKNAKIRKKEGAVGPISIPNEKETLLLKDVFIEFVMSE